MDRGVCPSCWCAYAYEWNGKCDCECHSRYAIQTRLLKRWDRTPISEWTTLLAHSTYQSQSDAEKVIKDWRHKERKRKMTQNASDYRVVKL